MDREQLMTDKQPEHGNRMQREREKMGEEDYHHHQRAHARSLSLCGDLFIGWVGGDEFSQLDLPGATYLVTDVMHDDACFNNACRLKQLNCVTGEHIIISSHVHSSLIHV